MAGMIGMSGFDLDAAKTAYEAGMSYAEIAADVGVHPTTVGRHLRQHVRVRQRGPRENTERRRRVVSLRNQGLSWAAIADQLHMSRTGARIAYARAGEAPTTVTG